MKEDLPVSFIFFLLSRNSYFSYRPAKANGPGIKSRLGA